MALQDAIISLNFGQGLDTKTDSKQVVNGKMVLLKDAVFTKSKQITKRNGYDSKPLLIFNSGASVSSPKTIAACKNEVIIAASNTGDSVKNIYAFSETEQRWVNKGYYESLAAERQRISESPAPQGQQSWASSGGIGVFAYIKIPSAVNTYALNISIVDLSNGTKLLADYQFTTNGTSSPSPKVCVIGSKFGLFYSDATPNLKLVLITVSGGTYSIGAPITIGSSLTTYVSDGTSGLAPLSLQYDVVPTSTGCALSYSKGSTVVTVTIDTTGAITHTDTQSTAGAPSPVTIVKDSSNSNLWVYWVDDTTPSAAIVYYKILSPTLASVLVKTSIVTAPSILNITAVSTSANNQIMYYSRSSSSVDLTWQNVKSYALTSGGVATAGLNIIGAEIFSKPFIYNGSIYLGVVYISSTQGTVFYVNMTSYATMFANSSNSNPPIAAKFLYGQAVNVFRGFLSQPDLVTSTKYGIFSPYLVSNVSLSFFSTEIVNSDMLTIDFSHQDSYQAVETPDSVVLNGGVTSVYDGNISSELGFNLYPEIISATPSSSGGSMADGAYLYYAVYSYVDANGNLYESSPGVPTSVTVSGGSGSGSVTLKMTPLNFSQRSNGINQITVYRTAVNGQLATATSGSFAFFGSSDAPVTLVDIFSDSTIAENPQLYTTGGVVDNISPPPSLVMNLIKDRVWLVDSTDSISAWYSKTLSQGTGISFSDLFAEQINDGIGGISGIVAMDDKIVFFKRSGIVIQSGDGPNDLGQNSSFSSPQVVPSDVGCTQSKGIILLPGGVFFKSAKGIYLLGRSISVQYIGSDVEAYNSQDVTSSVLIDSKSQVRFLTSSGLTLLYDYIFSQWSVFTNHTGYSSTVCNGTYVYTRADGLIFQESSTSLLDNASSYIVSGLTAWIKFSQVQGLQRVREFEILGDYVNGLSASHGIRVSCAYDFLPSFNTPQDYLFGSASSSGPFQFRYFLQFQKCDAVQVLIEEISTGATGESLSVTDMCLNVGVKKGLNTRGATSSVG